jgi:hypothetical protein
MDWLAQVVGVGLVLLALVDIYLTVLYARSGKGVLSVQLSKRVWQLFRIAARATPLDRDRLLAYSGPTVLVAIVVVWVCLLLSGFALIIWPELGLAIQASQGSTPTDFLTALYYSGYSLTTLGTGDLVPKSGLYRLLMALEAMIGFSVLTLTLTYFQSVYSALIRRNVFGLSLQHRTASTVDAAEMLARLGFNGDFNGTHQDIADIARGLLDLLESHHSYPVLHYFRFQEAYYALPRMVFVAMDTATLIKSALNADKYRSLVNSVALAELWGSGLQLLVELSSSLLLEPDPDITIQAEQMWRERYYHAVKRLRLEGIETASNIKASADQYISLRREWGPYVAVLAKYMAYDWNEIAPADCRALSAEVGAKERV